ncbi:MAG: mevalonate kinase [Thermoproteota archaeon]|nr:mevalonate kinase [Candidatus Brockarchaeota archaeon]MBO3768748.1 mevalonate kinase [Candidatus Brockarchaeota archaeon]MBO3801025.1 mevalonate kinase [Candidatus Brockarchaeota archaeon]
MSGQFAIAEAPTKVIISGEHSVVYGYPALVMAINLKTKAKVKVLTENKIFVKSINYGELVLDVKSSSFFGSKALLPAALVAKSILYEEGYNGGVSIETYNEAPKSSGLGSSGSTFVSVARAIYLALGKEPSYSKLFEKAMIGEKMVHLNPSGVDVEIAIKGGLLKYVKGKDSEKVELEYNLPLLVINSGYERNTGFMVKKFKESLESSEYMKNLLIYISKITEEIEKALKEGNLKLAGILLTANHLALSMFGVSNDKLDEIVSFCISNGAFGAKLTGAGGGGAVIALSEEERLKVLSENLSARGIKSFLVKKSEEGIKCWKE